MKKIYELLSDKGENYLFPFFWQHGERKEVIIEYMNKIYSKGIKAVCIESRPHPDFLGEGWWETMDNIIEHAKKIGMKLWILDDAKFPTGYANGQVPNELKKIYLDIRRFDVVGPANQVQINLNFILGRKVLTNKDKNSFFEIISVSILNKKDDKITIIEDSLLDVTDQIKDNLLTIDLQKGDFVIFVVYKTNVGGEEQTKDYLNPLNKDATQILINEVYEKHYSRYKEEFGSTILGFFSDEPRFGNAKGFDNIIGKDNMVIPYVDGIEHHIQSKLNDFSKNDWIYAFVGKEERAFLIKQTYMDIITSLYRDNFSNRLGQWCQDHGVDYTGHTIEDNNAHARLGYGVGHFFRGIGGQSISGIDIIGGQIVPGMDYYHDAFSTGGSDGEFYHYALCKLGASSAKFDSNKNGRVMCEAFGAYGWSEGLKMMKWITDHMISHGVNLIVPHAFSPKEFPDWDCPPHFYAHGNNPQFEYFESWSNYANRLCHLFNGGSNVTSIGVLYHAFAEWAGESMLIQKPLKELTQHQIDCNVISEDYVFDCSVNNERYFINGYSFDVLIVPFTQRMSKKVAKKLIDMSNSGVKIVIIDSFPEIVFESQLLNKLMEATTCIPLNQLSKYIKKIVQLDIEVAEETPSLTSYHYKQGTEDVFMFFNESIQDTVNTWVNIRDFKYFSVYDAMNNELSSINQVKTDVGVSVHINLKPYESVILVPIMSEYIEDSRNIYLEDINHDWKVELISYQSKDVSDTIYLEKLEFLTEMYPDFSGKLIYSKKLSLNDNHIELLIDEAVEIVTVYLNGILCGTKICPPYLFNLSDNLIHGDNVIEVHVVNTLGRSQKDFFSHYMLLEPLGMKNVSIQIKK